MSLSDGIFRSLAQALTPKRDARSVVSAERQGVEVWLERRLDLRALFESGSWSHGTATIFSDVDYFAWLPSPRPDSSTSALERLREEIAFWYHKDDTVSIRLDSPAVRVTFASEEKPNFEVVPAYLTTVDDYFIPDPSGGSGWIKSNPKAHKEYVNRSQSLSDGTKNLVRLIKGWAECNGVSIRSLYLEMRAAKRVLDTPPAMPLLDLDWLFREFLSTSLAAMNDPSEYDGRRILACDGSNYSALAAARTAQSITSRALDLERAGRTNETERVIRTLFNLS